MCDTRQQGVPDYTVIVENDQIRSITTKKEQLTFGQRWVKAVPTSATSAQLSPNADQAGATPWRQESSNSRHSP